MEAVSPAELVRVTEPEFQYGAEAFEAYQKETAMTNDKVIKSLSAKSEMVR